MLVDSMTNSTAVHSPASLTRCIMVHILYTHCIRTLHTLSTGLLLGASYLGNACAGSRLWCIAGGESPVVGGGTLPDLYQLRGYFCRTKGIFSSLSVLSLPFDIVDTALGCQGILTATEREVRGRVTNIITNCIYISYAFCCVARLSDVV